MHAQCPYPKPSVSLEAELSPSLVDNISQLTPNSSPCANLIPQNTLAPADLCLVYTAALAVVVSGRWVYERAALNLLHALPRISTLVGHVDQSIMK